MIHSPLNQTPALGGHIRDIRLGQNLSLVDLASKSEVSRATLSRIENNEVSPTADVLARLAGALDVAISQLIQPMERPVQALVKHGDQAQWHDPVHDYHRRAVSPPSAQLSGEVLACIIGPGQTITYDHSPLAGLEHHLIMLSGTLEVSLDGQKHQLNAGDCLRYKLYGSSVFRTESDEAHYHLVLL